jgi:hypothetical protein
MFHFSPARFGDNDKTCDLRLVRFTRRSEKQALAFRRNMFHFILAHFGDDDKTRVAFGQIDGCIPIIIN